MTTPPVPDGYRFQLYVAGALPGSAKAIATIRRIGDTLLGGAYHLEVIDLHLNPERASQDDILAVPTLILRASGPPRRIIGDLADYDKILTALSMSLAP